MIQRSAIFKVFCTATTLGAYLFVSVQNEARRVDELPLQPVNLEKVIDGIHLGGFVYQNQVLEVRVTTADHALRDIQILKPLKGDLYAKGAQALVSHILSAQKVESPTNANESLQERAAKKALLLAVQGAIVGSPIPSNRERSPSSAPGIFFLLAFYACCGSLGTQLAGYMAFRSGNIRAATMWVKLEDIALCAGASCCGLGLLLTMVSK